MGDDSPARALRTVGVAGLVLAAACRPAPPPSSATPGVKAVPPVGYATLPPLSLTDQDGQPFGTERLRGRVWITAFMFTTCPMECPLLSERMAYLQKQLATHPPGVQLLSISVNPQTDTPEVLKQYSQRYHRDPARWTFLTGEFTEALSAVSSGFERFTAERGLPPPAGGFTALHGQYLILIDGAGAVRGYYRKDDAEVARLLADADRLQ